MKVLSAGIIKFQCNKIRYRKAMLCTKYYGKRGLHLFNRTHILVFLSQMKSMLVIYFFFRVIFSIQSLINMHDKKNHFYVEKVQFQKEYHKILAPTIAILYLDHVVLLEVTKINTHCCLSTPGE